MPVVERAGAGVVTHGWLTSSRSCQDAPGPPGTNSIGMYFKEPSDTRGTRICPGKLQTSWLGTVSIDSRPSACMRSRHGSSQQTY